MYRLFKNGALFKKSKIENIKVRGRIGMASSGMESRISQVFRKTKKIMKNTFLFFFSDF